MYETGLILGHQQFLIKVHSDFNKILTNFVHWLFSTEKHRKDFIQLLLIYKKYILQIHLIFAHKKE